jgi:D-sedoheptulose 7-phosphate isomerase
MIDSLKETIESRVKIFKNLLLERDHIVDAIKLMEASLQDGNKILIFGNGGSAMQSSHFAAELVNKFYSDRPALPAIALTCDVASITSIANDKDFQYIFSRQLGALGKKGDIAIGITTSGKSANIIEAFKRAREKDLKTVVLCGSHVLPFQNSTVDIIISINSNDTPIIQEMHLFILHLLADALEKNILKKKQ